MTELQSYGKGGQQCRQVYFVAVFGPLVPPFLIAGALPCAGGSGGPRGRGL